MWRTLGLVTIVFLGLTAAAFAQAAQAKMVLVYADDTSQITITTRDGTTLPAQIGMDVPDGSSIITEGTAAELQMVPNGSAIRLAPKTSFRVGGLLGNPGTTSNTFNLLQGKFRMVAAKLARSGESYVIRTPTAIAGVRGTDFARRYDPAASQDWLCVLDGVVQFRSPDNSSSVRVPGDRLSNSARDLS